MEYRDANLSIEQRVSDLIKRMTLEEKIAQMVCVYDKKTQAIVDENGRFDPEKAKQSFPDGLGQLARISDTASGLSPSKTAELANSIQSYFTENTRLGIPVVIHEECLHGHAAKEATSFPQPIGLGATFDDELVGRLYEMTAEEVRVRGAHQALTPVVDVAREPRWGRVEETFGEDPYLVARMGVAAVRGFQGDLTFTDRKHVIATLKHFAAHGQPESGTNCAPVNVSVRVLREVFLYPFKKAVMDGRAISVMASYNEIDGIPSHANKWLLRDILRDEWGFRGYVVSDYYAIRELNERPGFFGQYLAKDGKEAAAIAAKAGVSIELPDSDCFPSLVDLVRDGEIKEKVIDELIQPMLEWKFRLGLFENPYVDPECAEQIIGSQANRKIALEAALKTITLLKNDNNTAPLNKDKIKKLAVIGPNADRIMLGGYSGCPRYKSTLLDGIKDYLGDKVEVLHHYGCRITIDGTCNQDEVLLGDPVQDRISISEAAKIASQADAVVLAIGGNEKTAREGWKKDRKGDRADIQMVGLQDELVDAVVATGKPVIAVLFNGRPLSICNVKQKVTAILECWYLGQESGHALAKVLFGEYNPGGKLPITIPRSVGHVPAYYNHKPSARRHYLFDEVTPLYAFGYGLSYTQFEISSPRLERETIAPSESVSVHVEVTNTGKHTGDEVIQMYIRDSYSSVTRPVKELKGFKRITLNPGQTKMIEFKITPDELAFYNIDMDYVVEPGEFKIMVGNSSQDCDLQCVTLNVS